MPIIGTPLLNKVEFSDLDEDGMFIVGSDRVILKGKGVTFSTVNMLMYGLEERKCQRVQFTELLRTVKHNIGKQCR